jgi:EmrB/QacA subfamily drug resistance transporter
VSAAAAPVGPPGTPPAVQPERVRLIFGALVLVLLLASLDQTIVSTALPTIVGDLGGIQHLSWVVTAYLLAATIAGPLYGKLGDLYGRKIVLQAAIVLFLAGSALCGTSQDMTELIAFRALQGLGGGGLMVTTIAVVGDIIPPRDRGRYQGFFGAVFGVSTVIGPLLGGFFVDNLSWRWIFYVNLPVGIAAFVVIGAVFRARRTEGRPSIDYLGTVVLAGALSSIVLFTSLGGTTYAWGSARIVALMVAGAALLALFPIVEARAAEPILPLELFRNRTFTLTSAIGFIVGLALFGSITYLPLYLQIVKGGSPTQSGLQLTPLMGGLLVTSVLSGAVITRTGRYRRFPIAGTAVMTVAVLLLARLGVGSPTWVASAYMVLLGLGLGMVMQVLVLAVQNSVDYRFLGVATAGSTMFRQVGGSIGVAAFGAIFTNRLRDELAARLPSGAHVPTVANPAVIRALPPPLHDAFVGAFAVSLRPVFLVAAAVSLAAFVLTWWLPEVPLRGPAAAQGLGESFASPRAADSERELERIATQLMRDEERTQVYVATIARAGVRIEPGESWVLGRIGERGRTTVAGLAGELHVDEARLAPRVDALVARGFVGDGAGIALTPVGEEMLGRLVEARRAQLRDLLGDWSPESDADLDEALDRLARAMVADIPADA